MFKFDSIFAIFLCVLIATSIADEGDSCKAVLNFEAEDFDSFTTGAGHNWTPFPAITLTGEPVSNANFITLLDADDVDSTGATARIVNTVTLEKNSPENTDVNYNIWVSAAAGRRVVGAGTAESRQFELQVINGATTTETCNIAAAVNTLEWINCGLAVVSSANTVTITLQSIGAGSNGISIDRIKLIKQNRYHPSSPTKRVVRDPPNAGEFATIAAAFAASKSGDMIEVHPKVDGSQYSDSLTLPNLQHYTISFIGVNYPRWRGVIGRDFALTTSTMRQNIQITGFTLSTIATGFVAITETDNEVFDNIIFSDIILENMQHALITYSASQTTPAPGPRIAILNCRGSTRAQLVSATVRGVCTLEVSGNSIQVAPAVATFFIVLQITAANTPTSLIGHNNYFTYSTPPAGTAIFSCVSCQQVRLTSNYVLSTGGSRLTFIQISQSIETAIMEANHYRSDTTDATGRPTFLLTTTSGPSLIVIRRNYFEGQEINQFVSNTATGAGRRNLIIEENIIEADAVSGNGIIQFSGDDDRTLARILQNKFPVLATNVLRTTVTAIFKIENNSNCRGFTFVAGCTYDTSLNSVQSYLDFNNSPKYNIKDVTLPAGANTFTLHSSLITINSNIQNYYNPANDLFTHLDDAHEVLDNDNGFTTAQLRYVVPITQQGRIACRETSGSFDSEDDDFVLIVDVAGASNVTSPLHDDVYYYRGAMKGTNNQPARMGSVVMSTNADKNEILFPKSNSFIKMYFPFKISWTSTFGDREMLCDIHLYSHIIKTFHRSIATNVAFGIAGGSAIWIPSGNLPLYASFYLVINVGGSRPISLRSDEFHITRA